jgi:hypothetical protein
MTTLPIYELLVSGYFQVMSAFPPPVAWLVSLLILVGLATAFIGLIRTNVLFLLLLILLLPAILPILLRLFTDLYQFFLFLLHQAATQAPKS